MNTIDLAKINAIQARTISGPKFFSFTYEKEGKGKKEKEVTRRVVSFGVNVPKAFVTRGVEITGAGNWHKGCTGGQDGMIIERDGQAYIRGIDTKDNQPKIFKLSGMSEISGME